jgi:hypothetical protein
MYSFENVSAFRRNMSPSSLEQKNKSSEKLAPRIKIQAGGKQSYFLLIFCLAYYST